MHLCDFVVSLRKVVLPARRLSEHREETKHSNNGVLALHTRSGQAGGIMLLFHSPDPLDPVTTVSTIFVFCFRLW